MARVFQTKKIYKGKTYKQNQYSFYLKRLKWRVILPLQVVEKLDDCIGKNPPKFNFDRGVALYFLSLISSVPSHNKDKYYVEGYVNLQATILKSKNSSYEKYFNYFEKNKIIQINHSYSSKKYSKSYRYNYNELGKLEFRIFDIHLLRKTYNKISKNEKRIQKRLSFLTKWFDEKLTIDFENVILEIQRVTKHTLIEEQQTLKKTESYLNSLKKIEDKEYWVSRNINSDNRIHSNITNMPSFFRKYICYNEKHLIGVDVKNSQPFFLMVLIEELMRVIIEGDRENKIKGRKRRVIERVYRNSSIICDKLIQLFKNKDFKEEFWDIKSKIISGKLYDDLEKFFDFEIENDKFKRKFFDAGSSKIRTFYFDTKRDVVKRLVLFFMYKSNKTKHDKDYNKFQ